MLLDVSLLNITRLSSHANGVFQLENFTQRSDGDIERQIYVAATKFCRSLPSCCEPTTASIGRIGSFLLRIAQSYFELRGHCNELEWCVALRQVFESCTVSYPEMDSVEKSRKNHTCKSPHCSLVVYADPLVQYSFGDIC